MQRAPHPTPGQTGPRRPYPSLSYWPVGRLADLSRRATPPEAHIVALSLTPQLAGNRSADTWSSAVVEFASGYQCPVCTTFDRRGFLLLEWPRDAPLNEADAAAAARAVVAGHVREQARQAHRGHGRN